jgi:hypothetical protein
LTLVRRSTFLRPYRAAQDIDGNDLPLFGPATPYVLWIPEAGWLPVEPGGPRHEPVGSSIEAHAVLDGVKL